jgi:hypothetical protein
VPRLPKLLSRRPPLVASPALAGQTDLAFGFDVRSELTGWTVTAYGADGRRLGRPLKGLSDPVQATLAATAERIEDPDDRRRLAAAWVAVCRESVTNADVLTGFTDAATRIAGERAAGRPDAAATD